MKKGYITIIALLLVLILAGCTVTNLHAGLASSGQVNKPESQTYLSLADVQSIAFKAADVEESAVSALKVELDNDDDDTHYDVSFAVSATKYEFEIDAETGNILSSKKEVADNADKNKPVTQVPEETKSETQPQETTAETKPEETKTETKPQETKKQISQSKAKSVALNHAGVKESKTTDLEVELDKDDGTLHYDVSFDAGTYDYEYEIDAYSGKILKNKKEKDNDNKTPTVSQPTEETQPEETKEQISSKKAKSVALNHAGVKESKTTDLEVELDKDDGTLHYDVSFDAGTYDYEYEIDAYSGKILKDKKEKDNDNKTPTETQPQKETKKTADEAKTIALEHAGVKEAKTFDLKVELDKDDGTEHYDVSFDTDVAEYEYEIDAETGNVLSNKKEKKDDDDKQPTATEGTVEKTIKTKAEAKAIAFKHAKVEESKVHDLEIELDKDDGKQRYEISFSVGNYDYEYEIDAETGKIIHQEKEKDE